MQDKIDVNRDLFSAVQDGDIEMVRMIINTYGLSYSKAWSSGYVLLRNALEFNHKDIAKLLLTSGAKVNSLNNFTNTPLHFAVLRGDLTIVQMIINKGALINAENQLGRTPLFIAVKKNNVTITELLLSNGADVNKTDNDGAGPLNVAVVSKFEKIVEQLLKYGASPNLVLTCGYAPLHEAVTNDCKEVIMLLLNGGANVDVKGINDITPLHIAAQKGYNNIANYLLNQGSCIHSLTLKEGYMPLHFASKLGNEETVQLFLNRGADINAVTKCNATPLHYAAQADHRAVVKLLLQNGASINNQDMEGRTALLLAVQGRHAMVVDDILKYCPDINNQGNRNSLTAAVLLPQNSMIPNIFTNINNTIVDLLLEYGLSIYPNHANNPDLLYAAVEKGYIKIVQCLLDYDFNYNILHNPNEGFKLLHSAIKSKHEEIAKLLIQYGADVCAQDEAGQTLIFDAIDNGNFNMFNLLLVNGAKPKGNHELLFLAVRKQNIEIIKALLQYDFDINACDKDGRTALHFTALIKSTRLESNLGEITKLLLENGANIDVQTNDCAKQTALHAAIENRHVTVFKTLLEYNANININCGIENDITPLHLSAEAGNVEITTMLLNKGLDVNAKKMNGIIPLHNAIIKGHVNVVNILLESGANVEFETEHGKKLLHLAAEREYHGIIKALLKFGADVNARASDGKTALHIASNMGSVEIIVTLLQYGSDINSTCMNNKTPLDYASAAFQRQFLYYSHTGDLYSTTPVIAILRHMIKLISADLYVSEQNVYSEHVTLLELFKNNLGHYHDDCQEEIASMKSEKINANISFYDILVKDTSSLAIPYMKNDKIVHVLNSGKYETRFPMYATMIERHFRRALARRELLEKAIDMHKFIFCNLPDLPYYCTEQIFSYLNNTDLQVLFDICKTPEH